VHLVGFHYKKSLLDLGQKYVETLVDAKITDGTEMLRNTLELTFNMKDKYGVMQN
jgi:hypothetical protein